MFTGGTRTPASPKRCNPSTTSSPLVKFSTSEYPTLPPGSSFNATPTPASTACANSAYTKGIGPRLSVTLSGISNHCAWTREYPWHRGAHCVEDTLKPKEQTGKDEGRSLHGAEAKSAEQVSEVLERIAKRKNTQNHKCCTGLRHSQGAICVPDFRYFFLFFLRWEKGGTFQRQH